MNEQEYKQLMLRVITAAVMVDGIIDDNEIQVARHIVQSENVASDRDSEEIIRQLITEINIKGDKYTNDILREVRRAALSQEQCSNILKHLFQIITADNNIDYREVRFFKKIRNYFRNSISDTEIMQQIPKISTPFLAPDVYDTQFR